VVDQNVVPDIKTADGKEHNGHAGGHNDPFADILLLFGLAILAAMVGRWGARLLNQPSVLGELLMGVLVGNVLYWLGSPLAFIVMHMDAAGEIFREVWTHAGTVQELLQQVFNADEMAPGAVGDLNRMAIGIGMVPRGEVGLIFASIGKGLGVVSDTVFTAVVVMVIVTTLIAPVGLKWAFRN
jgi:Kef-type K+ transport system membrane component KefB